MAETNTTTAQAAKVTITPQELATSAARNRQELIKLPVLALGPALRYFTVRSGIRFSETVGQLSGSIEVGPYDPYRVDRDDVKIQGRTLYTHFGSVVKEFDPNSVYKSIYGASVTKGEGLKNVPIVLQVLSFLSKKIGQGLAKNLFSAVRNDKGKKTADLFDGIDTITAKEIAAGSISKDAGNLFEFSEKIDSTNAVDMLTDFCRAANDDLLGCTDGDDADESLNLYVPRNIVYAYRDDYKSTTGHSPIYDKFNQTVVEGFPGIRLVPFAGKAKSNFIQLSTKGNMLIGTNQMDDTESMTVEKHHPFLLQFIATLFFGTDFESVAPERLLVGKLYSAPAAPSQPVEGNGENS